MDITLRCLVLALVARLGYCSNFCETRKVVGFACESCEKIVSCIKLADNWRTINIGYCDTMAGEYCNNQTGSCSSSASNCDDTFEKQQQPSFLCTGEGIFPDPYDCKIYHACSMSNTPDDVEHLTMTCPDNSTFSPSVNDCVANSTCPGRPFNCSNIGNTARWPGSKRVYYVCVDKELDDTATDTNSSKTIGLRVAELLQKSDKNVLPRVIYPILLRCTPDQVFSNERSRCEIEAGSSTAETATPGNTVSECTYKTLKKHPSDCRSYLYCDRQKKQVTGTCPVGTHFRETTQSCTSGNC